MNAVVKISPQDWDCKSNMLGVHWGSRHMLYVQGVGLQEQLSM